MTNPWGVYCKPEINKQPTVGSLLFFQYFLSIFCPCILMLYSNLIWFFYPFFSFYLQKLYLPASTYTQTQVAFHVHLRLWSGVRLGGDGVTCQRSTQSAQCQMWLARWVSACPGFSLLSAQLISRQRCQDRGNTETVQPHSPDSCSVVRLN